MFLSSSLRIVLINNFRTILRDPSLLRGGLAFHSTAGVIRPDAYPYSASQHYALAVKMMGGRYKGPSSQHSSGEC